MSQVAERVGPPVAGPGSTLLGRIGRGLSALSLGAVAAALAQIVTVPVALLAWGQVRYGEWVVITGLVTFLRLADMGLQTYVVNRFGAAYAQGDRDGIQRSLHSALRVQLPLFAGLLVALALAFLVVPMDRVLGIHTVGGWLLYATLMLLAVEFLVAVPVGVVTGLYRATGYLPRAAMIGTIQQVATMLVTVGLIAARADFATVALGRVVVLLAGTAYVLVDLRRIYPWLGIRPVQGSWREGMAMVVPGLFFLLFPAAEYLSSQVTLLIVQQQIHGAEVSRLATHRTVVNLAQMASNLLIAAVWYELTRLHALDERGRLAAVQSNLVRFNVWLVGGLAVGLLPFIGWLYPGWTAGKLSLDWWTLGFLLARLVVWSAWNACLTVLVATNRHRRASLALVASALVTCGAGLVLVPRFGIAGAAAASLIGDLAAPAWMIPRLAARETGVGTRQLIGRAAGAFGVCIALPALLGFAVWSLAPVALVRYGLVVPAAAALALRLMWGHIPAPERGAFVGLVRSRLRPAAANHS